MKLIYHLPLNKNLKESPFKTSFEDILLGSTFNIACPYIDIQLLKKYTEEKSKFRILTDIEEWLKSNNTLFNRKVIIDFISENKDRVRHQSRLHAKVIFNEHQAVFGSANLTKPGVSINNEFSILIKSEKEVLEIRDWFEYWWEKSSCPDINEIIEYCNNIPAKSEISQGNITKIKSTAPKILYNSVLNRNKLEASIRSIDGNLIRKEIFISRKHRDDINVLPNSIKSIKIQINSEIYNAVLHNKPSNLWISTKLKENNDLWFSQILKKHGLEKKVWIHFDDITKPILISKRE